MLLRCRVLGTIDFQNLRYLFVFNTSGSGFTPYANSLNTQFLNFSFILQFGGTALSGAGFSLFQVIPLASGGFQTVALQSPPQFVTSFNANSNGLGNEFTFTFNRFLLTPLQSTSPTPVASPTPVGVPTQANGVPSLWAINLFSAAADGTAIDGIAFGGISDTTFTDWTVDTTQVFDRPENKASGFSQVSNVNAQITAGEVINQP